MAEKRKLRVDFNEVIEAFEMRMTDTDSYLDSQTGQVILLMHESMRHLEHAYDLLAKKRGITHTETATLDELVSQIDGLPEWQSEMMEIAYMIDGDQENRFLYIEPTSSDAGYRDMTDFTNGVEDSRLRERLWAALDGRRPFRRFKDVLATRPNVRNDWFKFKDERTEARVLEWLDYHGIEPIVPDDCKELVK